MAAAPIPRSAAVRPAPLRALREAVRVLGAHPLVALGLGAALVLSLVAVCCGAGLVAAPWLACELMGLTLGVARGRRLQRHAGWIRAAVLLAVAVLVAGAAVLLALTWMDAMVSRAPVLERTAEASHAETLGLVVAGSLLALLYLLPYLYAPLLLIERGGSLTGALAHSAAMVLRGGMGAHLRLSCVSHLLQVAPLVLAAILASTLADASTLPVAVAIGAPLTMITVPLGQAMIVTSYAERTDPQQASTSLPPRASRPVAVALAAVGLMPAVSLLLIVAALTTRPSLPPPGTAPRGEVVARGALGAETTRFPIPHTALVVWASAESLTVEAGDGGATGAVPLPPDVRLDRLRVVRVRDAFAVELGSGRDARVVWIDRAGVRLDDGLPARLRDHVPPWGLLLLVSSMLGSALALGPGLARLASPTPRAERHALWIAGALLPLAATTLGLGVAALLP